MKTASRELCVCWGGGLLSGYPTPSGALPFPSTLDCGFRKARRGLFTLVSPEPSTELVLREGSSRGRMNLCTASALLPGTCRHHVSLWHHCFYSFFSPPPSSVFLHFAFLVTTQHESHRIFFFFFRI